MGKGKAVDPQQVAAVVPTSSITAQTLLEAAQTNPHLHQRQSKEGPNAPLPRLVMMVAMPVVVVVLLLHLLAVPIFANRQTQIKENVQQWALQSTHCSGNTGVTMWIYQ